MRLETRGNVVSPSTFNTIRWTDEGKKSSDNVVSRMVGLGRLTLKTEDPLVNILAAEALKDHLAFLKECANQSRRKTRGYDPR